MKKFKKMYVEITNVCNLNCNFCPKTKRPQHFMTCNEFETIAKKLRPFGEYIYLHVLGEPLLHKNLEEVLNIAEKLNFKVNITTNGTLIGNVSEILLKSKALHMISISLHSFEANTQNMNFSEYIKNIANFCKKASNIGKICSLRLWNSDGEFTKGSNSLNEEILKKLEKEFQLDYTINNSILRDGKNLTVKKFLYIEKAKKFEWPNILKEKSTEECFCYGLRDQIGVLCDGSVVPCCLDHEGDICFGNLFKNSLEEILNSKRAVEFYNGFTARQAVEKLCQTCGFAKRFQKKGQ